MGEAFIPRRGGGGGFSSATDITSSLKTVTGTYKRPSGGFDPSKIYFVTHASYDYEGLNFSVIINGAVACANNDILVEELSDGLAVNYDLGTSSYEWAVIQVE